MNTSNGSIFNVNVSLGPAGGTGLIPPPSMGAAERISKIVICCFIIVVAFVGNILIIVVVCRNAHMRKTINYFIVNMSVSDLVIPIFVLPRVISENITPYQYMPVWRVDGATGDALCKSVYFVSDLSPVVSIFSLICITVDRFCAIVFPMKRTLITSRVRLVLIALTWIFSAVFFSPYFYYMRLVRFPSMEGVFCLLRWSGDRNDHIAIHRAFVTANCILFVLIPVIVLTVMYTTIMAVVKFSFLSQQGQQGSAAQRRQRIKNNRLLRLAVLTVVSFAVCWGPYNVYLFVQSFVWGWQSQLHGKAARVFSDVVLFLTYSNSMINPCLYFIFIENYRRGLRRVFKLHSPGDVENRGTLHTRLMEVSTRASSRRTVPRLATATSEERLAANEVLLLKPLDRQ